MESLNLFKGYNKVVEHDKSPPTTQKHPRHPLIFIAISLTLLLTVAICLMIGSLILDTEGPDLEDSIRTVCSVTHYPVSCFAAISNHSRSLPISPDPNSIFVLSLQLALTEVRNLTQLPKTLLQKANDKGTESALRDCATLFDDAVSQLSESTRAMEVDLTDEKVGDLKTWISAAMSDEETCLDGLEEMGSTMIDETRTRMQRSKEYLSNSLAILFNMNVLLEKSSFNTIH